MRTMASGPESLLSMHLDSDSSSLRAEAFLLHSRQLVNLIAKATVPSPDELVAVQSLLEQLHFLLEADLAELRNNEDEKRTEIAVNNDENQTDLRNNIDNEDDWFKGTSPCLRLLLAENVLGHALAAARMPVEPTVSERLLCQQLQLLGLVVSECGSEEHLDRLLSHSNFGKPLKSILVHFEGCLDASDSSTGMDKASMGNRETKSALVSLATSLCHRVSSSRCLRHHFLRVVSEPSATSIEEPRRSFALFKILLHFVHDNKQLGQQARNALVGCLVVAKEDDVITTYLIEESNFCEFLAAGLAALYSSLPHRLPHSLEQDMSWCHLDSSFENASHELQIFLSSLLFCDIVTEISHPRLRAHLLALIYVGFLVPVLGPALVQNMEYEVLCATAYLDLFLRKLQHRPLASCFLRFLFIDAEDSVVDKITSRLSSQSRLCHVTLGLFETLLSFHNEDVLLMLVFRHLINLEHLVLASRFILGQSDPHGGWADALLALTPICTQAVSRSPDRRRMSTAEGTDLCNDLSLQRMTEKFNAYLTDAKSMVRTRFSASREWLYDYDGITPVSNVNNSQGLLLRVATEEAKEGLKTNLQLRLSSSSSSCSPSAGPVSMTESEERDFWNLLTRDSALSELSISRAMQFVKDSERKDGSNNKDGNDNDLSQSTPTLGPFLESLIELVSQLPTNQLPLNLTVTSLLSQLAAYPHPLLKATLLSPDLVFQPSVRSLHKCIGALRSSLDNIMPTLNGADDALISARAFLQQRIEINYKERKDVSPKQQNHVHNRRASVVTVNSVGDDSRSSRPSLGAAFSNMFRRPRIAPSSASSAPSSLITTQEQQQTRSRRQVSSEAKEYAMAAVLLEEWLQELAAIAQEHTLLEREQSLVNVMSSEDLEKIKTGSQEA